MVNFERPRHIRLGRTAIPTASGAAITA
jgi:hypothetical protein